MLSIYDVRITKTDNRENFCNNTNYYEEKQRMPPSGRFNKKEGKTQKKKSIKHIGNGINRS